MKQYYLYILASSKYGTLYIGVTSDIIKRVYEHKQKTIDGFSKKYNVVILVYYEIFNDINEAIIKEKRIKRWHRDWKIRLIEENNADWIDLYPTII